MASPTPDASAPSSKPQDSVPDTKSKSEVNGHASPPASETKTDDASTPAKPLVNGNGTAKDHPTVNGVAGDDMDTSPVAEAEKADPPKKDTPPEEKPEESKEAKEPQQEKAAEEPVAQASEDVVMADAAAADESTKPGDKPAEDGPADAEPRAEEPAAEAQMTEKADEPASSNKTNEVSDAAPSQDAALPTSEIPVSVSQLAIETTEAVTSPAEASVEVSMTDAPNAKVSREREDDFGEEPAPKRAKTEPKDDESLAVVVETAFTSSETQSLSSLTSWDDVPTNDQVLTPFQRREIRKIILRVKKTKAGGSFRDSVQKLWPGLWESYSERISKPMDLGELDRNTKETSGVYTTLRDFKNDLSLIYENAHTFNGPGHDVTMAAFGTVRMIWEEVIPIPAEEPARPKSMPKAKPVRESRTAATTQESTARRQSTGPAASPTGDVVEAKPAPVVQAPPADARRASAGDGDRPKRTVRAPKPKDIDYSTKSSRKKLKPELQFCEEVLTELMHPKNTGINTWFMDPVDAEGLNIPQYYSIIKKPMDLNKIHGMLSNGEITGLKDFDKNVRLVFSNCYTFNGTPDQGNAVSLTAKQLEDLYTSQMKGKDAWLAKHAKANAPPAATSNASDDDEDEDDDEGDDAAASGVDYAKEVRVFEAKLAEEMKKLQELFAADTPNQSMIEMQQTILKMVQEALLKRKQDLADFRQRQEKSGKKGAKTSKAKASGGAASRKSTGHASQPKKAGGSKKAAQKRNLTAADKDQIASAINDLDYPHLDRAIDIIKRDTGQAENNDGELELDIDQLSNEALLKLWELLKKVLPNFAKDSTANHSSPEVHRAAPAKQASRQAAPKSKKNKPMSAQEQEKRISQLKDLQQLYKGDKDGAGAPSESVAQGPTPNEESSDESDSEEE